MTQLSFQLVTILQAIQLGVTVGAGLQTKVAVINLVCYYVIGIPIEAVLGYVFQLQVKGIWIGMISGIVAQTLALSFMSWKTNLDDGCTIYMSFK
ncbi:hypothetical protein ACS0TY_016785 [Phlomoides rotata]